MIPRTRTPILTLGSASSYGHHRSSASHALERPETCALDQPQTGDLARPLHPLAACLLLHYCLICEVTRRLNDHAAAPADFVFFHFDSEFSGDFQLWLAFSVPESIYTELAERDSPNPRTPTLRLLGGLRDCNSGPGTRDPRLTRLLPVHSDDALDGLLEMLDASRREPRRPDA